VGRGIGRRLRHFIAAELRQPADCQDCPQDEYYVAERVDDGVDVVAGAVSGGDAVVADALDVFGVGGRRSGKDSLSPNLSLLGQLIAEGLVKLFFQRE
jgi:hypothetical protein